jgi:GMP synthase-like glutamine amidotransferase
VRALVIAHEPDGGPGQIGVRLIERGLAVDVHLMTHDYTRPNVAAPLPDFDGYDLIVPMGSVRSLTNMDEISTWVHDEIHKLRRAHDAGTPILGICFGGQLMAHALGGSVELAPEPEIGWYEIHPVGDTINPAGKGPWMQWHHDRFSAPPAAEILARTETAIQLFRIGRTVGTQFHPEVDYAHIAGFVGPTDDSYLQANGLVREKILADAAKHEVANIKQCHALVDWFLDDVAVR